MSWHRSVLVVANVTACSDELCRALRAKAADEGATFTLLLPDAGPRFVARRHLENALERLRAAGLDVAGRVGDADPVVAVREMWNPLHFDEIVVSTKATHASRWILWDVPHRLERLTGVPVTHVVHDEHPAPVGEPAPKRPEYGVLAPLVAAWRPGAPRVER
jgi:hypothetical protein